MERLANLYKHLQLSMRLSRTDIRISIIILVVSCLLLSFYEAYLQHTISQKLFRGFYFQEWPSDVLMQTVSIHVLRENGPSSFWYLHIQPPIYDFIRYLLSFGSKNLDSRIYLFYCLIYGAFNQLVYIWSLVLGFQRKLAVFFATVWAICPGNIAMATFLDSTYLSAFLIAWTLFSLYLYLRRPAVGELVVFLAFFLVTSLTRTLFQFHFLVFLPIVVTFWILTYHKCNLPKASLMALPLALATFLLPLKQQYLYGTFATTTFAGQHEVEGIWYRPSIEEINSIEVPSRYIKYAQHLQDKANSADQVAINYRYERIFRNILVSDPVLVLHGLRKSLLQGFSRLGIPTQDYMPNRLIETLPWVGLFSVLSSGYTYLLMIALGLVGYLLASCHHGCDYFRPRYLVIFGFIGLVLATIVVGSNRYGWTEAERLKFLIDAPILLFSLQGVRLLFNTSRLKLKARLIQRSSGG